MGEYFIEFARNMVKFIKKRGVWGGTPQNPKNGKKWYFDQFSRVKTPYFLGKVGEIEKLSNLKDFGGSGEIGNLLQFGGLRR